MYKKLLVMLLMLLLSSCTSLSISQKYVANKLIEQANKSQAEQNINEN